jgi:hypothetical protein
MAGKNKNPRYIIPQQVKLTRQEVEERLAVSN